MNGRPSDRPLITAGTAIGMGMGGFVDGIVLHQILQVHNMLSAKYPTKGVDAATLVVNLQVNMFWDGLFHAFTWIVTAVGLALLWGAMRQNESSLSTRTFVGSMILGWGLFNLVEGVIDHHILHIHHVTETENHLVWDLAFITVGGVLLIFVGLSLIRAGRRVAVG